MSKAEQLKEANISSEIEIQYFNHVFEKFVSDDDVNIQEDYFVANIKIGKNMTEVILSNVCYPTQHFQSDDGKVKVEITFKIGKVWKSCLFDLGLGKNALLKFLGAYGFLMIDNSDLGSIIFTKYFWTLLQFLLNTTQSSKLVKQVGWQNDDCNSFVYGTKIINSKLIKGEKEKDTYNEITFGRCVLEDRINDLEKVLLPKGDEKLFKEVINKFFNKTFYKQQCSYLLGVSSPLLEKFGQNGVLVTNYSKGTGYLKSVMQKLTHLTYFNENKIVNSATDTATIEGLRKYKNFAFLLEEFTILMNENPEKARGLIYKVPAGISKLRSNIDSSNQEVNDFHNSVITSNNESVYTIMPFDVEAELVRCLEICYDNDIKDKKYQEDMNDIYKELNNVARFNGGHGLSLIKSIMTVKNLQKKYEENYDFFINIYGHSNHRYTCAVISTAYTMAEIMSKLGYTIDLVNIKEEFINIIKYNLEQQKNKMTTKNGIIEKIMTNLRVTYLSKTKDNKMIFDSEMTNNESEYYDAYVLQRKELIIPKEIFESKLLSGTKLKPSVISINFKEVQKHFGDKLNIAQRKFKGAKMTCLVINLEDLIESKLQKVRTEKEEYDYKSNQEHIDDAFSDTPKTKEA